MINLARGYFECDHSHEFEPYKGMLNLLYPLVRNYMPNLVAPQKSTSDFKGKWTKTQLGISFKVHVPLEDR